MFILGFSSYQGEDFPVYMINYINVNTSFNVIFALPSLDNIFAGGVIYPTTIQIQL